MECYRCRKIRAPETGAQGGERAGRGQRSLGLNVVDLECRDDFAQLVTGIVVHQDKLVVQLKSDNALSDCPDDRSLTIPWQKPPSKRSRQILLPHHASRNIDRLTRSLADFAKLVELFDAHDVSFVSVTQQFNTTTSMGRLIEEEAELVRAIFRRYLELGSVNELLPIGFRLIAMAISIRQPSRCWIARSRRKL
jgi:hypothetical protein